MSEKFNLNKEVDTLFKHYNSKNFKEALVQANKLSKFKIKNKEVNLICGELFLFYRLYKKNKLSRSLKHINNS